MRMVGQILGIAISLVCAYGSALAQETSPETRLGEEGFESPPATLAQMEWLVGQWKGEGIGGAPALESWLSPTGGTMVGTFIQESADGGIQFTEHLYLMEEEGTLVLRLKHFNADLTGWEERDKMLTFRLVAIEPCAAYFHALTLRCADADKPGEGLVAAVRMRGGDELLFRFDRLEAAAATPVTCRDANTTLDMNECYAEVLLRADDRRSAYLAKAIERYADRPTLVAKIKDSEAVFAAYRDAECGAVLEDWIDGTIRGVKTLSCRIEMTDRRTDTIWQNWLTYMDSTPPIMPQPDLSL